MTLTLISTLTKADAILTTTACSDFAENAKKLVEVGTPTLTLPPSPAPQPQPCPPTLSPSHIPTPFLALLPPLTPTPTPTSAPTPKPYPSPRPNPNANPNLNANPNPNTNPNTNHLQGILCVASDSGYDGWLDKTVRCALKRHPLPNLADYPARPLHGAIVLLNGCYTEQEALLELGLGLGPHSKQA